MIAFEKLVDEHLLDLPDPKSLMTAQQYPILYSFVLLWRRGCEGGSRALLFFDNVKIQCPFPFLHPDQIAPRCHLFSCISLCYIYASGLYKIIKINIKPLKRIVVSSSFMRVM